MFLGPLVIMSAETFLSTKNRIAAFTDGFTAQAQSFFLISNKQIDVLITIFTIPQWPFLVRI